MKYQNVYDLIKGEEANYKLKIPITENWEWNMYDHIKMAVLYKNAKFINGTNDGNRPYKNIIRPILNLQYRAEGFDVKDIILFIDDPENYYKSFLVKKFHERWARENNIDTFIDQLVESFVDFGIVLVKNVKDVRPEVVPMQRLAFCDQTSILSGPIAEKHYYSPSELQEMGAKKWQNIDTVIKMAEFNKDATTSQQANTPGKYIEVYEIHGSFPKFWLNDDAEYGQAYDDADPEAAPVSQVHICTFYYDEQGQKHGVTLFKSQEPKPLYKVILRDEIYGRACGLGGVEELEDPQVWINYDMIRMKDMLDAASKVILKTTDPSVSAKHPSGLKGMDTLEIIEVAPNTDIDQLDTFPRNLNLFEKSVTEWKAHAQQMGAANDSIMGQAPTPGTPFKLQELVTQEAHSLHEYRKGKLAVFVDEIYRDWILPHIAREITNGKTFLSELSLDELQQIADNVVTCQINDFIIEKILNGEMIDPAQEDMETKRIRDQFMKTNHQFIEILKGELKDVPLAIRISINGKQKDLAAQTDKLVNIFRTIAMNPQVLQNPAMAKLFNQILESSNLEPLDFSSFMQPPTQDQIQPPQPGVQPPNGQQPPQQPQALLRQPQYTQ
jgi:hypothetical protein